MNSIVCTLFEGNYNRGVAALTNSLYKHGYRGEIYAGYKGILEGWATNNTANTTLGWLNASTLKVAEGLNIHFLPLETKFHLTNYKPFFIKELFEKGLNDGSGVVYFDPDIVIKCRWSFYEEWLAYGVAMVQEGVHNPMHSTHPVRKGWEKIIEKTGRTTNKILDCFCNAGFCGIASKNIEFIETWIDIINIGILEYGYKTDSFFTNPHRSFPFTASDQDAFNMAAMCCKSPLSIIGPEGMDFVGGGWTMSHATGSPKPWDKKFIQSALKAILPTRADKEFWDVANTPINLFSNSVIKQKKIAMSVAGLIGRFYSRK